MRNVRRRHPGFAVWRIATALALLGCASALPESAAPKGQLVEPSSIAESDAIPYRTLVRADFKGTRPPPSFAAVADAIGAATCAHIRPSETRARIEELRAADGETRYRATPQKLRFTAQMDRGCSWWNPVDPGLPSEYVLQHEQIHFAIVELGARALNADIAAIQTRIQATAASKREAIAAVERRFNQELERLMEDILARSRKFDEETSMGHHPAQQKRWWRLVEKELAATNPRAETLGRR